MVSLLIVLGAAYLLRHRWKSFRKSLTQPQQEQVTEQTTPEVQDLTTAETALEDQAELRAADEFVTEPIPDEVFPRIEQTLNPVITQEAEEDSGAPFDPESLIDDDYFNDAADLQSLRSNNAQLGDQLEARAGSVESAPKDQRPIDDLLTETTALCCGATTMRTDEHSSVAADFSRDQDREFTDGLIRDGRSSHSSGQREGGGENSARHWAVCRVSAGDRNQLCDEDLLPFARLAHGINRLSGHRRTDSASRGHPKATP